jgi:FKBP12-rapamycin complex-associated protein
MAVRSVDFEVRRALEWLASERSEARRHAAVMVLKELAINAPTLFYVHVPAFVELIWSALRDPKLVIREGAVEALRACLELIAERESRLRQQWYQKILEEALKGFRGTNYDHIHGSLLVVGACARVCRSVRLSHSLVFLPGELLRNTGDFMKAKFGEICEIVMKHKDSSNKLVKKTMIGNVRRHRCTTRVTRTLRV